MKNLAQKKKIVRTILVFFGIFLITSVFFILFQFKSSMPLFSGEDSFYHVGMAKYILNNGIKQTFPYLYFTTLNARFVDHELLFHLILIPFIKLFGENVGPKILDVLFISLTFSTLFLIFRHFKLKLAWFYPILILFVMPCDFYFRMAFIRVQGVALFLITLSYYLILANKKVALLIVSFLFVWLYGGSIFLPALMIIYLISQLLSGEKISWKIIIFGLLGFILGFVINPYFPKNVTFLYSQIFQTGIGAKSYSGGEWQPYDTWYWVTISIIPIVIFFGGMILALARNIKIDARKLTLILFSFFMLLLQWKSKRFVEYLPFFATTGGIIIAGQYLESSFKKVKEGWNFIWYAIVISILFVFVCLKSNVEISNGYSDTQTPINVSEMRAVNDYLINNSEPNQIVFTDDWDVFPFYFFFNQKNYYIVGLDPEFMNQYNHTLYEEYADISSGNDSSNLERIKNDFSASWVLVGEDHPEFNNNLATEQSLFKNVFQNRDYTLYKVR